MLAEGQPHACKTVVSECKSQKGSQKGSKRGVICFFDMVVRFGCFKLLFLST